MKNHGFKKSKLDGSEHVFEENSSLPLPVAYSCVDTLPEVINQGTDPICVPCSISAFLNWRENLSNDTVLDNKIDLYEIYNQKKSRGEGMSFKEALQYLRHHGVKSERGVLTIGEYAMVKSLIALKYAILTNGPCFGGLPVYNDNRTFWEKRSPKEKLTGYHAIAIVGYAKDGLIIRNSWGKNFANNGYTILNVKDFDKLVETWTILS